MFLEVLVAPAGMGKTEYILEDIDNNRKNKKIFIITPNQNSYNYEKVLAERFLGTFNIDVVNLNSLLNKIAKKLCLEDNMISEEHKLFYYLELAKQMKDKHNSFIDRVIQDAEFIPILDEVIEELSSYHITIENLNDFITSNQLEAKHKIVEIKDIYAAYLALLSEENVFDNKSYIDNLINLLDYVDFSDYIFYIDAYFNFTKKEYKIIEKLILKANKVVVSIVGSLDKHLNNSLNYLLNDYEVKDFKYKNVKMSDVHHNLEYALDIFRKSHEMLAHLNDIVDENNIQTFQLSTFMYDNHNNVRKIILSIKENNVVAYDLCPNIYHSRYKNKDLLHLVKEYPKISKSSFSEASHNIEVFNADTIDLEVRQVARNVLKLKKENHYSNEDFTILYRDSAYENYVNIFSDYGIKIHLDKDIDVSNHRLIRLVKNILTYDSNDYKTSILNILKTKLTNISLLVEQELRKNDEIKYSVKVSIYDVEKLLSKSLVKKLSDLNSQYFLSVSKEIFGDSATALINVLKAIDKKITILKQSKDIQSFVKNIGKIFDYFDIKMLLDRSSTEYDSIEELELESKDRQVYAKTLKILDNYLKLGKKEISLEHFSKILLISLSKIKYRNIPEINDAVIMSKMDLAKVENKKVTLILGFNRDIIPSANQQEGIIDDNLKELLIENYLYLSPTNKSLLVDEEFVSYIAISRTAEKLMISYSNTANNYSKTSSSLYLNQIKKIINFELKDTDPILKFSPNHLSYYLEHTKELYAYTEVYYLLTKFVFEYKMKIRNASTDEEKEYIDKLETLISLYNHILKTSNRVRDNIENHMIDNLSDVIEKDSLNYNSKFNLDNLYAYEFSLNDELKEKFLNNNSTLRQFSHSKLAAYQKNSYQFFVNRILNVKSKDDYSINALNTGNFMHAIMDTDEVKGLILTEANRIAIYDEEDYINEISKLDFKQFLKDLIHNSTHQDIVAFKELVASKKTNQYIIYYLINRLNKAIQVEIHYFLISNYKFYATEYHFELEFYPDKIIFTKENKVKTFKNHKQYQITPFKFTGKIDRIDVKDHNYLVIDYKSSQKDFDVKNFYNDNLEQLLTYLIVLEFLSSKEEMTSNYILGAFYREISNEKPINQYRLRGLVNTDILLKDEASKKLSKVMYMGIKATDARYLHRTYTATEIAKMIDYNIDLIMNLVEKIQNFDYQVADKDQELRTLYDVSLYVFKEEKMEFPFGRLKAKEKKEMILDKIKNDSR